MNACLGLEVDVSTTSEDKEDPQQEEEEEEEEEGEEAAKKAEKSAAAGTTLQPPRKHGNRRVAARKTPGFINKDLQKSFKDNNDGYRKGRFPKTLRCNGNEGSSRTPGGLPPLEPWMRQTVVLKLKEVDGRVPSLDPETFSKQVLQERGFSAAETLSIQSLRDGLFYVTFISVAVCRRFWDMVKMAQPDSPLSRFVGNCSIQREERKVTVTMRNPHTPGKDIATFLHRFCTVMREPAQIRDRHNYWTGKWSLVIRLRQDSSSPDGFHHLPSSFSLGNSFGTLRYGDQPMTCMKCSQTGHQRKECKSDSCRICKVAGHELKDCPKRMTCNLCGEAAHVYKDCPQRTRSYASAATRKAPELRKGKPEAAPRKGTPLDLQLQGRKRKLSKEEGDTSPPKGSQQKRAPTPAPPPEEEEGDEELEKMVEDLTPSDAPATDTESRCLEEGAESPCLLLDALLENGFLNPLDMPDPGGGIPPPAEGSGN
ncbi:uncharacterized protein RCH25_016045 [Pelodytes ibericus]